MVLGVVVYTLAAEVPVKEATSPAAKKSGDLQTDSSAFYGYGKFSEVCDNLEDIENDPKCT